MVLVEVCSLLLFARERERERANLPLKSTSTIAINQWKKNSHLFSDDEGNERQAKSNFLTSWFIPLIFSVLLVVSHTSLILFHVWVRAVMMSDIPSLNNPFFSQVLHHRRRQKRKRRKWLKDACNPFTRLSSNCSSTNLRRRQMYYSRLVMCLKKCCKTLLHLLGPSKGIFGKHNCLGWTWQS